MGQLSSRKRRFGDRSDGYRVRNLDPFFQIIPCILRRRCDSQVMFDETLDLETLDRYIRQKRSGDLPTLRLIHVLLAASVRTFSQKPKLNRFILGKKIYARNCIKISIAIKRSMSEDGEETTVTPEFEPSDTLRDIVEKFDRIIAQNRGIDDQKNSTDVTARIVGACPTFLKSAIVVLIQWLDNRGLCPKIVGQVSPFHASAFITDVGSLGIGAVFHHLYEFGTCSVFVALGKRTTIPAVDENGEACKKKAIGLRFVLDERICDGFYSASAIKFMLRLLKRPELLEVPPEKIIEDS